MDRALGWFDGLILLLLLAGVGLYLYARASQRARLLVRAVSEVQRHGSRGGPSESRTADNGVLRALRRIGTMVPLMNAAQRTEASAKLVAAGYRSNQALFVLMALTLLTILLAVLLLSMFGSSYLEGRGVLVWLLAFLGSGYLGSLLPRLILDRLVRRRQEAIRLSLPDALDLLVICTNAGLALNAALERVADEMEVVAPALADELKLTATELKLSSEIESVLTSLAERTGIEGMRTLVNTFLQARQYGTAITQSLRILAKTERTARMMRLEERAAKMAVKMTVPMMLFILPTVVIVGAGPAILSLMKTLGSM
ncbi:type II secretion system F family protein [Castellaniella sp. MT123]|uniref:type II secretion system F family protein n=1 Tax=Castellaniella sp. MT123 TaxID=3140381 RepID=UPI0031F43FB5